MNRLLSKAIVCGLLCAPLGTVSALGVHSEFNLQNAYRNDNLRRINSLELVPPAVTQVDKIQINCISLWQVGLDFRLMLPHRDPADGGRYSVLQNFFFDGFAYWGFGGGTTLREQIENQSLALTQNGRASLNSALTYDYQIGLGYLFNWAHWDLGLSGGYAFDRQKISTKSGQIAFPSSAPYVNAALYGTGYSTKTTWKGPWAGLQLFYELHNWRLNVGYEFHFAQKYAAKHNVPQNAMALMQGSPSNTKASGAFGNVGYVNWFYQFYDGWEFGIGFKYQNWRALSGHLKSSSLALNQLPSTARVPATGQWIAYSANVDIGYAF